jgi:hypothetical protein
MLLGALAILPSFCDEVKIFTGLGGKTSTWNLEIPVIVNSFGWVFAVVFIGLLVTFLWFCKVNLTVKLIASYIYAVSFLSAAPYIAFNALLLLVPAIYLYLLVKHKCDKEIIINWAVAIFWFEVAIAIFQFFGKDTLINFDRPQSIFLGTVMQHMRSGSLFAILAPFLLLKNRLYIIPLVIVAFLVYSSSMALALAAGAFVYFLLSKIKYKKWIILACIIFAVGHSFYNHKSFEVAFTCGRIPRWTQIINTGLGGIYHKGVLSFPDVNAGLLNSLKGFGLNHFNYLFPVLIEDPNPFAQCHNDWMQFFWEIGFIGLFITIFYYLSMLWKLYFNKKNVWIAGMVIIAVNMFFAFPTYMPPQTPLLMLVFFALAEKEAHDVIE